MTFPPRHILVPVEPTRESEAAVSAAAALAAALDAELTLLGVAPVAQAPMSSEGALLEVIEQRDDQQVLDQLTQERLDIGPPGRRARKRCWARARKATRWRPRSG